MTGWQTIFKKQHPSLSTKNKIRDQLDQLFVAKVLPRKANHIKIWGIFGIIISRKNLKKLANFFMTDVDDKNWMQCTHKVLVNETVAFAFISVDLKPFFTVLEFHSNGVTLPVQNTISYRTDETHTLELRNEKLSLIISRLWALLKQ